MTMTVTSALFEMRGKKMSQRAKDDTWDTFMRNGTTHSKSAMTLPYIINRCEQEGIAYELQAWPGYGYFIKKGTPIQ